MIVLRLGALPAAVALLCLCFAPPAAARKPHTAAKAKSRTSTKTASRARTAKQVPPGSPRASAWLRSLNLHDKAAQLVVIPFSGQPVHSRSREYRKFLRWIRTDHVGGLILVNVSNGRLVQRAHPLEAAAFVNKLQKLSRLPLLVAGDFERGVSMRIDSTTVFPHAMAFAAAGDPDAARFQGEVTARESRALGFQWIFYPDADVNNNPDNPIINIRSFGENPQDVSRYVTAFIQGAQADRRHRVLTTAKHFPGHGDTATDSHVNLASSPASRERLDAVELVPFRAAIAQGVDSIMTAHIALPALDSPDLPATLSSAILTKLLRQDLGFTGLIVTDALEMGGIAKGYSTGDAAVRAIEAGADVLLMPTDPEAAISAVVAAVKSGRISQKRLDASVARVLAAKVRVGLDRERLVNLENITEIVDAPEAGERAQQIADRAVTLVKNQNSAIPLRDPAAASYIVLTESRVSSEGTAFVQEVKKRAPAANLVTLDPGMSDADAAQVAQKAAAGDSIVVAAFVSVAAYRGDVALPGGFPALLKSLIASRKPVILIALGSPYVLRSFPDVSASLAAFSTVPLSETAVVKALFGEIPIQGKLPVTIPGIAAYHDGISLPVSAPPLPSASR